MRPWLLACFGLGSNSRMDCRTLVVGLAAILNSRRCGRTHCRYTGPFYLAMIAPVLALGLAMPSAWIIVWLILGVVIVGGSCSSGGRVSAPGASSRKRQTGQLFPQKVRLQWSRFRSGSSPRKLTPYFHPHFPI